MLQEHRLVRTMKPAHALPPLAPSTGPMQALPPNLQLEPLRPTSGSSAEPEPEPEAGPELQGSVWGAAEPLPLASRVGLGLGRIVASYHRSSTSYQTREDIRSLYV